MAAQGRARATAGIATVAVIGEGTRRSPQAGPVLTESGRGRPGRSKLRAQESGITGDDSSSEELVRPKLHSGKIPQRIRQHLENFSKLIF